MIQLYKGRRFTSRPPGTTSVDDVDEVSSRQCVYT